MIDLAAKFSLIVVPPLVIAVAWQKRTGAAWTTLLFALVAFSVHYFARSPLVKYVSPYFDQMFTPMVLGVFISLYPKWFIFGLFRACVWWLTFRYVATNVLAWRDGVLFGIAYTTLAILVTLWTLLSQQTTDFGLAPPSIFRKAMILKDDFLWMQATILAWNYGVILMAFNVGTSLVILFGVRRRQVWPLLVAALLYILINASPWFALWTSPHIRTGDLSGGWVQNYWLEIVKLVASLPAICLILFLRKPLRPEKMETEKGDPGAVYPS
ncbi:MAG: YhfC family intramembrane metalloprotease [Caldilineaceae bacterium SB0664_bin_27]|uniref:YhfC family intramembrane metalloprotease n=1 Tax=Caldilineaceae bacterium SB0664_bin_27 TaxID=2605260 RepID=A0A6B0Z2X2_9CHLR|nr:YhfC family intramembrane metalloprotease [Caldilineaceae bacterium SB0664_bin_27]